jgi:hypothetical protein
VPDNHHNPVRRARPDRAVFTNTERLALAGFRPGPPGRLAPGRRRTGAGLFVANLRRAGDLRAGLSDERAADAIWALSPDILWTLLVAQRRWTPDEFELWYAGQVAAAILDDKQIPAVRRFSHKLITTAPSRQRHPAPHRAEPGDLRAEDQPFHAANTDE